MLENNFSTSNSIAKFVALENVAFKWQKIIIKMLIEVNEGCENCLRTILESEDLRQCWQNCLSAISKGMLFLASRQLNQRAKVDSSLIEIKNSKNNGFMSLEIVVIKGFVKSNNEIENNRQLVEEIERDLCLWLNKTALLFAPAANHPIILNCVLKDDLLERYLNDPKLRLRQSFTIEDLGNLALRHLVIDMPNNINVISTAIAKNTIGIIGDVTISCCFNGENCPPNKIIELTNSIIENHRIIENTIKQRAFYCSAISCDNFIVLIIGISAKFEDNQFRNINPVIVKQGLAEFISSWFGIPLAVDVDWNEN